MTNMLEIGENLRIDILYTAYNGLRAGTYQNMSGYVDNFASDAIWFRFSYLLLGSINNGIANRLRGIKREYSWH